MKILIVVEKPNLLVIKALFPDFFFNFYATLLCDVTFMLITFELSLVFHSDLKKRMSSTLSTPMTRPYDPHPYGQWALNPHALIAP